VAHKEKVSFDETHGLYHRRIGNPKFHAWLGSDELQAQRRAERLELLWSQVEADWANLSTLFREWTENVKLYGDYLQTLAADGKPFRPQWDDFTRSLAKAIAKGETTFKVARNPAWSPGQYTARILHLQRRFNAVAFVAEDVYAHETGSATMKLRAQEAIAEAHKTLGLLSGHHSGQTWHQVIDAYIAHLDALPDVSGWYRTQKKQCKRLKEHSDDVLLGQVGLNQIESWVNYWRHRPDGMAEATCRNELIQLQMVLKWLHRSEAFSWRKPDGLEDIKQTVVGSVGVMPTVETFSLDALTVLWRHASPLVRLEMLLALNCGFKEAEIASLALSEIHLEKLYPGIVQVDRPVEVGNWILRFRRKTRVYGEWKLWDETVAGIKWVQATRKVKAKSKDDLLLVTKSGLALDAKTASGNKTDKIYKSWQNLYRTIRSEHDGKVRYLPFKCLEKTATDWLRHHHGWEVGSLFTAHGKPVKSDTQLEAYSRKPFGRLFAALDAWRAYLQQMFAGVIEPWHLRRIVRKAGA
jgi:hypothetical protein